MAFMDLTPPPRPRGRGLSLTLILGASASTLILFGRADDEVTGRPQLGDALGFTAAFLAAGCYIAALPLLWRWSRGRPAAALVMPGFVALVLGFLYLGLRTYFVQPGATGPAVLIQLFVLVCVLCRAV